MTETAEMVKLLSHLRGFGPWGIHPLIAVYWATAMGNRVE
jgi:hypothetical protein